MHSRQAIVQRHLDLAANRVALDIGLKFDRIVECHAERGGYAEATTKTTHEPHTKICRRKTWKF